VVAAATAGGVCTVALAALGTARAGAPTLRMWLLAALLGCLLVASWLRPLMMFVGEESEALHLDEYFLVVLLLVEPTGLVMATFAAGLTVAQAVRRRPVLKSAFNVGQVVSSAGIASVAFHALGGHMLAPGAGVSQSVLGAAVLAAVVFTVCNHAAVGAVLAATGAPWRAELMSGLPIRTVLSAGSIVMGLTTGALAAAAPHLVYLALVPPLLLRQVLADQFEARRDHTKVRGLFTATLAANRTMGAQDVVQAIEGSAAELLRCTRATIADEPVPGALYAELPLPDATRWLSVWGRSRGEPFDHADQGLLEALAAVATGALNNARLYEEGRRHRERLATITASMGEGVCAVTRAGEVTFVNPAAAEMLGWSADGWSEGWSADGLSATPVAGFQVPGGAVRAPGFIMGPTKRAMASATTVSSYDTRFERSDGSQFYVAFTASPILEDGRAKGAVLVFRDITERKAFEEQLTRHAFHDSLTGLPNRRLFLDHLDHALRRSQRSNERHAVLFVDVDRFKVVNDSLGHHAGDRLLVSLAERMRNSIRPGDMLARFGGDEFTILLEGVRGVEDAVTVAGRILNEVNRPVLLPDGHEVVASISVGIAVTSAGKTRDDLLHDADVAMYRAKGRGRGGQYEVYDADAMGNRSADRIELEAALRSAIENDELEVYFQPVFSLDEAAVVGAEALVRWNHPERGLLAPGSFIGLAEETGLILPLGRRVLEHACAEARAWEEAFGRGLSVSVNLSARQFQQSSLAEDVEAVLRSTGVQPAALCLEITESLAMDDMERTRKVLVRLKELGVRVAIDDFGTGHSALGYLTQFPVDVVKVDRTFVDQVEVDPVKSAIVSAVIKLAEAIGTTAVVEGVETAGQLEHLRALGCRQVQGFYLARPLTARQLREVLAVTGAPANPAAGRGAGVESLVAALARPS
jgi:diguanylate cyclase (GGDEF)-like protein